jgi:hypothetical protein
MAASALQKAISGSLHDSDLFTRYSPSQFLIMVGDINRENCEMVARRVSARFRELCASERPAHDKCCSGLRQITAGQRILEERNAKKGRQRRPDRPPLGLSGLELGMELCSVLLNFVGRDGFHGGVRPDNIRMSGPKPELGPPLTHSVGEFTPQELEYMSPELFWSGERTPAADVYSVGLTMYAIYNGGRLPFWPEAGEAGPTDRTLALQKRLRGEDIPPPPGASQELSAVIMRSLAFRAEERWRDSEELRNALGDCSLSEHAVKAGAEAAAAVITLAGSPLDKSGRELSEMEHMMAEIIEQGKPALFQEPEAPLRRKRSRRRIRRTRAPEPAPESAPPQSRTRIGSFTCTAAVPPSGIPEEAARRLPPGRSPRPVGTGPERTRA